MLVCLSCFCKTRKKSIFCTPFDLALPCGNRQKLKNENSVIFFIAVLVLPGRYSTNI